MVHVRPEQPGMDEFGSEHQRFAEPAFRDPMSAWGDWSRDEWAFRIVTTVAVVEAVILIVAGISLSGVFGGSTGTIIVDSQPAAAEVRLDGEVAGVTPLTINATEGQRAVEVRHQRNARTIMVNVVRGETTHSMVEFLAPQPTAEEPGEIRITSEPAAAQVSIDGVVHGSTPLVVPGLASGAHAVSLRSRTGQVNRTINVTAGQAQTLHVLLPPAPPAGPGFVTIGVPTALRVFENGRFVGATGAGPIALSPGAHELELVNEDLGLRLRQRVEVQSGTATTVTPLLPRGSLAINAQPWAEVWLNGERVGETPLGNVSRPVGQYEVLLRHPDFGERRTRVRVAGDTTTRLNVDMRQGVGAP